jgi:serine/threonine protein kinase
MIDTSTSFVGTPLYMAPEVLTQQPYSMEMDIWSLGSVMFELCTLEVPFRATTVDALKVRVSRPSPSPKTPCVRVGASQGC